MNNLLLRRGEADTAFWLFAAKRYSPWTTLAYGLLFAAVFWLVVLGPRTVASVYRTPQASLAILSMAVVSTIIPFGAFLSALRYIPPTNATVTSTIEPVIAGVGAYVLFGETFSATQLLGGLMVIAAIVVVERTSSPAPIEVPPGT